MIEAIALGVVALAVLVVLTGLAYVARWFLFGAGIVTTFIGVAWLVGAMVLGEQDSMITATYVSIVGLACLFPAMLAES